MPRQSKRLDEKLIGLVKMPSTDLQKRWSTISAEAPPKVPAPLLRRLLAQRLQERRHGSLPVMVARELERKAGSQTPPTKVIRRPALTNGTRLVREWNGQTVAVEVVEGGFIRDGRTYRSLSEIAREVTGAHWSGPRFFGLTRRG